MLIKEDAHRLCDRCGDEISLHDVARFHVERPMINGSLIRRDKHPGEGRPFPVFEFDLCTKCADEFVEWLKQHPETSEEAEEKTNKDKDNSMADKILHCISYVLTWLSSALAAMGFILVLVGSIRWAESLLENKTSNFMEWIAIGILVAMTGLVDVLYLTKKMKSDWKKEQEKNDV